MQRLGLQGSMGISGAPTGSYSHNDVFFRKRSESGPGPVAQHPPSDETEAQPPVATGYEQAQQVLPELVREEAAAPSPPPAVAEPAAPVTVETTVAEPPVSAAEPVVEVHENPPPADVTVPQAQETQTKPHEGGLLKGLFRRFRR